MIRIVGVCTNQDILGYTMYLKHSIIPSINRKNTFFLKKVILKIGIYKKRALLWVVFKFKP